MSQDPHATPHAGGQQPGARAQLGTISGGDVTPAFRVRGICMDAVGALKVDLVDQTAITFASGMLAAGIIHPLQITKVYQTGTGAQNIILIG